MFKQKSIFTVREATAQAFLAMPETFSLLKLVDMTRKYMARPACTDGTITRRLRELRDESPEKFGYIVIDSDKAKYQKSALKPAQ